MTKRQRAPKRKYLHLITDYEWKKMVARGHTWGWLMKHFLQPRWCGHPDALQGAMGCWSLIYRYVKSENYCRNCDYYKGKRQQEIKKSPITKELRK